MARKISSSNSSSDSSTSVVSSATAPTSTSSTSAISSEAKTSSGRKRTSTAGSKASTAKTTSRTTKNKAASPKNVLSPTACVAPPSLVSRIAVTEVQPVLENGAWPAKAVENEAFPVTATVFREGHDAYSATALLIDPNGQVHQRVTMYEIMPGLDRYEAYLTAPYPGNWSFQIEGWSDPYATWCHEAAIKVKAFIDTELVLAQGAQVLKNALADPAHDESARQLLTETISTLTNLHADPLRRLEAALSPEVKNVLAVNPLRELVSPSAVYPLRVDRERALVGSWYEFFPRSVGATKDSKGRWTSGNFRTAAEDLPRVAAMGFEVIYLPPIHPIGLSHRKGKNNSLHAKPGEPGSPWAIGSSAGGHDAIHPDLGTFADFDHFVATAHSLGIEVALDLALQCSPDHPWVKTHPEWFTKRVDGSIAYAENPPKKYQDIYPLNFDNDPDGIFAAVLEIVELWISHGVTIFRVDNPHTKPVVFWQKLLHEVYQRHPEIVFLAEAFTRPAMMRTLGACGFHQNYSYFPWRNNKEEITAYFNEVAYQTAHTLRPAFWPTTPDILTPFLSRGGAPAFALRAVLAATGAPTWGIYSGYELAEATPRQGYEEQNDNEKYEYRPRDYRLGAHLGLSRLLADLNQARAKHPSLRRLRNITFHPTSDDSIICYSRTARPSECPDGKRDTVIVVVNLDPFATREGVIYLDLSKLEVPLPANWNYGQNAIRVHDELTGEIYLWNERPYVCLRPLTRPAHILSVEGL